MTRHKQSWKWKGSNRKSRLPDNWQALRRDALARCGNRCEVVENGLRCTKRASDVDHIIAGDDHSPSNLRGICPRHHLQKSSREGNEAKRAKRASVKRPPEENPPPPHPLTPPTRRGW